MKNSLAILVLLLVSTCPTVVVAATPVDVPTSLWGEWQVTRWLPTTNIGALSRKEMDSYIGKKLRYTPADVVFDGNTKLHPTYTAQRLSASEFFEGYLIPLSQLGTTVQSVVQVDVSVKQHSFFGTTAYVLSKTRIVVVLDGGFFQLSRAAPPEGRPEIGQTMNKRWLTSKVAHLCMTHPAQLDPCIERVIDGVQYTIAYSNETKLVTYISTRDERFRTSSGLKVGDTLKVTADSIRAWPGWEIHAPATDDGWRPIIGFNLPEIQIKDGTVLDLADKQRRSETGVATIVGFSKGKY